jgi:NAD(P)-dependent dehydrogenase (short-subunit alcohol dehydrogenase family)
MALAFAARGATVILAARRASVLSRVAQQCRELGGHAVAVPTDVSDPAAVDSLARRAVAQFGRIDLWINNAAVLHLGRFDETPLPVIRRVLETNLFGYIHGARAAIRQFRAQGHGTLINVSSVLARVSQPYAGAYVASKFAIRGLTSVLRQELQDERRIHVCAILPAAIDTPIYQRAANFSGRAVRPIWPRYPASVVADAALALAFRPRREIFAGSVGPLIALQGSIAPALTERLVRAIIDRVMIRQVPASPSDGNLFSPTYDRYGVSGGWKATTFTPNQEALVGIGFIALTVAGFSLTRMLAGVARRRP